MAQNTTIKDIARALGISKSTVSRALADRFDVKPETKKAVLEMAEKMHYRPNPFAQNLIKRRTKIVGVVVPEFINSFFARIIIQIQKVFEQEGFHVLITQCNESAEVERRNLQLLEESMVEGILISVAEKDRNTAYYRELIENGIPLVFFNRASTDVPADKVVIDDYKWSFFAVEHLVNVRREMGQSTPPRIMHFQGPAEIDLSGLRYRGYADALRKHGLPVDSSLVVRCESITRDEGFRMMNDCLDRGLVPDALFGFNDQLAIGAMKALKRRGIRVPDQVSVMGFTESQSALVTEPMLSSVAQPLDKMGETAARLLLDRIRNPNAEIRTVVLEGLLNVRGSSDSRMLDA